MKSTKLSFVLASMLALSSSSFADDASDIKELKQQVKELQEMSQTLIDETSDLKTGFNYTKVDPNKSHTGLGPAASKVYYSKSPLSIGGYGQMYYSTTTNENTNAISSETQVKRFVTYFGYKLSDSIIMNTEVEYEGGGARVNGTGDAVVLEFFYLDFLINEHFNLRAGNFLVPMGYTNQQHEPTILKTTQRPKTSRFIIPSTWGETGLLAFGDINEDISYKAGFLTALQLDDTAGDKWLRNGRGGSYKIENPRSAGVARIDYTGLDGLFIGAGVYADERILMTDIHGEYKIAGARFYGAYAKVSRSGTIANSTQVTESYGGFLNASYDFASLLGMEQEVSLFTQYENYNPQATRANGTNGDDTTDITFGANYFPLEQVVLKADYVLSNKGDVDLNIASVSLGFIF
ncbi:porin [Sulfurimonas sp. SAG-AH-194-C21]|nr:porin [Sulfurimonas sp. SAG-AH-194-C21]MDF1883533.1 porin [Sulfurimonas sp. SAG-AH-194-C21]